jgi:hypothetical protein
MMRRNFLLTVLAPLLATCAHAQIGIYVTSSSHHLSNVQTGSVLVNGNYQEQYTDYWASGIGGGVTLSLIPLGPVKLGFDFRGSTRPGTPGADTAMGGFKVGFNLPKSHWKPYVEGVGGYVEARTVNISTTAINPNQTVGGTFTNKYAAWEILGGVDYRLMRFLDFRLVEVGGGTGIGVINASGGRNVSLFTVNSGLVLHF